MLLYLASGLAFYIPPPGVQPVILVQVSGRILSFVLVDRGAGLAKVLGDDPKGLIGYLRSMPDEHSALIIADGRSKASDESELAADGNGNNTGVCEQKHSSDKSFTLES